ncbi:hypothetical protein HN51_008084 [Arachis hypogaea]
MKLYIIKHNQLNNFIKQKEKLKGVPETVKGNKKNPKNNSSSTVSSIAAGEISKEEKTSEVAAGRKSISPCEVPRSPTLPTEICQSRATKPQSPTAESHSPTLVARLMGLDEAPEAALAESVVEKRRQLLGALQRCDEDLKALKKIIEAVQLTDTLPWWAFRKRE